MSKYQKTRLVSLLKITINRKFPEFFNDISILPDFRKRPKYEVKELIFSGLLIFLFRQGSRNQADNAAKNLDYQDNIKAVFGLRVADCDTVDKYLRLLLWEKLELVKQEMIKTLIRSKHFKSSDKFRGLQYFISIDGSGLQTFKEEPYRGCPFKTSKSGKKTYTAYVLEAKLLTPSGFALSLASVWVENPLEGDFGKQDCELEAFKRLSKSLKKKFPRLPMILLLDGLYPKEPVFKICSDNSWLCCITLKDKSLKTVQEEIADKKLFKDYSTDNKISKQGSYWISQDYKIYSNMVYKGFELSVVELEETKKHQNGQSREQTRFVHITNVSANKNNSSHISEAGRLRWKIENEGFNTQKNSELKATHKYSRVNSNATKNYYNLLQISEIICQIAYKQAEIKGYIQNFGNTVKSLIKYILSLFEAYPFEENQIEQVINENQNKQIRY